MLDLMEPTKLVKLQVPIPENLRREIRTEGIGRGLDMGDLNTIFVRYCLDLLHSPKPPKILADMVAEAEARATAERNHDQT